MSRKSLSEVIPGYKENGALQLVVATGLGFILYNFTRVTLIVFGRSWIDSYNDVAPFVGLSPLHSFASHAWTLLTYGWVHNQFFEWLSNAVWLYTFGSVIQMLVGHRQVIPTFIYGLLAGGLACLLFQYIPSDIAQPRPGVFLMTSQAGVMALLAGAITLAPRYRFYLGERLAIPLLVVAGIYLLLNVGVYASGNLPMLILGLGGAAAGMVTMLLLKRGFRPGSWMYTLSDGIGNLGTPDEDKLRRANSTRRKQVINLNSAATTQQRIDAILDKIHQRGYGALTKEERELLQKESGK